MTSSRVVGRLADQRLAYCRWGELDGVRVDLTPGREAVAVDVKGKSTLIWSGPAVAPLALAAVFHLYGPVALIEHPALGQLRVREQPGA